MLIVLARKSNAYWKSQKAIRTYVNEHYNTDVSNKYVERTTNLTLGNKNYRLFVQQISEAERHAIKIVEEPSSYGIMNSYQGGLAAQTTEDKLKMRVTPSNFSGPVLFKRFLGKCFNLTDENYKYELCPFSNVTQHEQSLRWNPYSGILGVWQEWEIENNTFISMVMREGDKCGDKQRSTKVYFTCGKENKILNVSEPSTCNYRMEFSSPYVCHKHAMLVYPILDEDLQREWGILRGNLARKEITMKGYRKYLRQLFVKAGFMLSERRKEEIASAAVEKEKTAQKASEGNFDNLYTCTEEYRKLKKELDDLKAAAENNHNYERYNEMEMPDQDDYHVMDDF